MGAKHGAQSSAVWASDSAVVLLDGIEASDQGKGLAEARLRALHPLNEGKDCNGPGFLDKFFPFLRWWAALKMKESQCPEHVRVTHPA